MTDKQKKEENKLAKRIINFEEENINIDVLKKEDKGKIIIKAKTKKQDKTIIITEDDIKIWNNHSTKICFLCGKQIRGKMWFNKDKVEFCSLECIDKYEKIKK